MTPSVSAESDKTNKSKLPPPKKGKEEKERKQKGQSSPLVYLHGLFSEDLLVKAKHGTDTKFIKKRDFCISFPSTNAGNFLTAQNSDVKSTAIDISGKQQGKGKHQLLQ